MFAVIETGGKQYKVQEGDVLFVEKLDAQDGQTVEFDRVLAVGSGNEINVGSPVVSGAKVSANVIKSGRGKKIRIFKFKAKKGYRRRQGHRQPYTKVQIVKIEA